MRLTRLCLAGVLAMSPAFAGAQEKKPAQDPKAKEEARQDSIDTMEKRANEAFNRGQYSLAKELFTKLADRVKDSDKKRYGAIQEQIRVCDTNIKQLAAAMPVPQADLNEPKVETAPEKRKKHVAPTGGQPYVITMKELRNFEYDPDKGGNIPEDVKKLTGTKIRVQVFMIPLDQADNISHFSLVPSLFACCFGQPPQIQHTIVVQCPAGKAVSYYPDEIAVEGTLGVKEKREDGYIVSVFEMTASSVTPVAK